MTRLAFARFLARELLSALAILAFICAVIALAAALEPFAMNGA